MAAASAPAGGWSEPPWSGWIANTGDALLMLEAARRGVIPRVTRRLVDSERKMITSGSVFVFDEDESGIKRWTDGLFWSPSRILGNFLLYRETDKRGAGHKRAEPQPQEPWDVDSSGERPEVSLSRPKGEASRLGIDRHRERTLVGSLTNSYKFKANGLMKKTFSLTIAGVSQHLISYYKIEDVESGRLRSPSTIPELAALEISPEYLDKTHFRVPPKVEIGPDGLPRYCGEADDEADASPLGVAAGAPRAPLLTDVPIAPELVAVSPGAGKRGKRFNPYGAGASGAKRARKSTVSGGGTGGGTGASGKDTPQAPASPASPEEARSPTSADEQSQSPGTYTSDPSPPLESPPLAGGQYSYPMPTHYFQAYPGTAAYGYAGAPGAPAGAVAGAYAAPAHYQPSAYAAYPDAGQPQYPYYAQQPAVYSGYGWPAQYAGAYQPQPQQPMASLSAETPSQVVIGEAEDDSMDGQGRRG